MTRGKRIDEIREELSGIAEKEAYFLYRMARKAGEHGCSADLVREIREEANWCYNTAMIYPDRLICWKREYDMKYAFKIR